MINYIINEEKMIYYDPMGIYFDTFSEYQVRVRVRLRLRPPNSNLDDCLFARMKKNSRFQFENTLKKHKLTVGDETIGWKKTKNKNKILKKKNHT